MRKPASLQPLAPLAEADKTKRDRRLRSKVTMIILAIGAHPDDVELGAGGTIAKHVQKGATVHVLVISRGERGVPDNKLSEEERALDDQVKSGLKGKRRELETKQALEALGVNEANIKILGHPDMAIIVDKEVTEQIATNIAKLNPDIIYTHYSDEEHLDHVNTSLCTLHSARRTKSILFYESPSTRPSFSPSYFVDISDFIRQKIMALGMHKTQQGKQYMEEDVIRAKARFRGSQAKIDGYAEAFVVHRMIG